MAKGGNKAEQWTRTTKKLSDADAFDSRGNDEPISQTKYEVIKNEMIVSPQKKVSKPSVLRYVSLSRRKKGELLFVECSKNLMIGFIKILKENFTTLLTKIEKGEVKRLRKKSEGHFSRERNKKMGLI